jgi:hypothetical protein
MRGSVRLVAWCLAIALVALPVVGVLHGWFAAGRWPVTQLTVQGEFRHVGMEEIRAAVLPRLGRGFFALNLDSVQQAVAALPWVESVEARKRWPDTLQLRVIERQPFARWIECTVDSMSTTMPLRMPRDTWVPMPITVIGSPGSYSPTIAVTLEVPISRPTTSCLSLRVFICMASS